MGARQLIPDPTLGTDALAISPGMLSFLTALASVAILSISLAAALIDRRTKRELRQQKVLLDTALENMSQGLCMFDADGSIVLANERYAGMMGLAFASRTRVSRWSRSSNGQRGKGEWKGDPAQFVTDLIREHASRSDRDTGHRAHQPLDPRRPPAHEERRLGCDLRGHHRMGRGAAADLPHGAP